MILRLGTGEMLPKQKGYLNVDLRDLPQIDVIADAAQLPFKDGEHDGIETRNLVEHFSRHEIAGVFKEWARVLKKGGILKIETVDMGLTMDYWKDIPQENWLDAMLGAQTYPENFHKMAFTEKIMKDMLVTAGFSIIDFKQFVFREIPRMAVTAQRL